MTDSGKRPSFLVAIFGLGEAAGRIHLPASASRPGRRGDERMASLYKATPKKLALVGLASATIAEAKLGIRTCFRLEKDGDRRDLLRLA